MQKYGTIAEGNNTIESIRSKIIVNVLILLFTIISIIGIEYDDLRHLAKIQGIGAKRSADAVTAETGARIGLSLHDVINDAVIILDLTMPHMDGEQCFRELRQIKPDVKVIMSSGYNEQEVTQKFVGKGLAGFIQKPYKLSVLEETIRKIV
ncbi:MAG: response regulator [Desulfuromonadaceae bacterium]